MSDIVAPPAAPVDQLPDPQKVPDTRMPTDFADLQSIIQTEVRNSLAREKLNNVLIGWITGLNPVTVRLLDGTDVRPVLKNTDVILSLDQKVGLTHTVNGWVIDNYVHPVDTQTEATVLAHNHDTAYEALGHSHPPGTIDPFLPYGRFYLGAAMNVVGGTDTKVNLNNVHGTNYVGSLSGGTVTVSTAGLYLIHGSINWTNTTVNIFRQRRIRIDINGIVSGVDTIDRGGTDADAAHFTLHQSCSIITLLPAGAQLEMYARTTNANTVTLQIDGGAYGGHSSYMGVVRLGPSS